MGDIKRVVRKHQDGAILDIFVTTGNNKNIFPAGHNKWRKRVEIKVASSPKDSMANIEIIKTTAKFFGTPVKNVWIVSGKNSREKTIFIKNFSVNAIVKKLEESLNGL